MKCECADPNCPVCHGKPHDGWECTILYRVDMDDETGTVFCEACADDAFSSGVFTDSKDDDLEDDDELAVSLWESYQEEE